MTALPDFDTLKRMAQHDPNGLEQLRQQQVEAIIAEAPPEFRQRLRGLQFQIDAQRQLAKTPTQACIKLSEMMHDSFARLRHLLNTLADNGEAPLLTVTEEPVSDATVLPFPSQAAEGKPPAS